LRHRNRVQWKPGIAVGRAVAGSAQRGGSIGSVPSLPEGLSGLRLKSEGALLPARRRVPVRRRNRGDCERRFFFGKVLITKICASYFETQQIVC